MERARSKSSLSPVLGLEDWKIFSEFTHTHTQTHTADNPLLEFREGTLFYGLLKGKQDYSLATSPCFRGKEKELVWTASLFNNLFTLKCSGDNEPKSKEVRGCATQLFTHSRLPQRAN